MSVNLRESVTSAPVKTGNRWKVIVAVPGQGSSGFYSEEVLKRDAEKIIAPGGQMFINHDSTRNPKDMIAIYPDGSKWSDEDGAVVAEAEVFSHWKTFVEEVGPHCGASLYALGESDEAGNVTAILEDRMNGADLVARPGLIGSGLAEKLYESAIAAGSDKPSATVAQEGNGVKMDQEMKDAFKSLADQIGALVADKDTARAAEAQVAADDAAVEQRVESFAAAVTAVDEAELFASQRATILEAAKKGADITPLIESAKLVKEEALTAAGAAKDEEPATGRIVTESATSYGAWK